MNTSPPKSLSSSSSSSSLWSSSSSSSSSSSPISSSSSPQLSRIKSIEVAREQSSLAQRRMFRQESSDSFRNLNPIRPQEASCSQERSLQEPQKLSEKGNRIQWYHWFTREGVLRDVLLSEARDSIRSRSITKSELENIVECCRKQYEGVFASKLKCQILGFRILHYVAENSLQLSQSAIDTLIDKLREPILNAKTLPYVTMGLGYAIYFDSTIKVPGGGELFDRAIDQLLRLDKKKYFEAIVIALIAKAKQVGTLSDRDLTIIQQALAEPNDSEIADPLYHPSESQEFYPPSQHLAAYRTRVGVLTKIKAHVKIGNAISRRELDTVIRWYDKIVDPCVKNKILEIVQRVFSNRQRKLHKRDPDKLFNLLQQVLTDDEFKLRSRALIVANILAANDELPERLKTHHLLARHRQMFYALSALREHLQDLQGPERTKFSENPIWKKLLEKIDHQTDEMSDNREKAESLKDLANYILFQLSDNRGDLEYLIFRKEYAVFITGDYLNEVRQRKNLSPSVMKKLQQLILDLSHQVPLEAILNATAIFRYVAENGDEVDQKILENAIEIVVEPSSDLRLRENALLLLWAALPRQSDVVMCEVLLTGIPDCLTHCELISASCSLLSVWLEKVPAPHFEESFSKIFSRAVDAFAMIQGTPNDHLFLTQVLGKAAEKKFIFSPELFDRMITIAESSKDLILQDSFVSVFRAVLAICPEMEWCKKLFELLFRLSQSDQESYLLNAGSLLCRYMTILKKGMLPDSEMDRLATLFSNEKTAHLAIEVFDELVLRKITLTNSSLLMLASVMLNNTLEIDTCVASLLRLVAKYQQFPQETIEKVIQGLSLTEELVVVSCVEILTENIFALKSNYRDLGKKSVDPLIEVAAAEYYHLDARLQAFAILSNFSKKFSLAVLEKAIALLSDGSQHIQLSCIQLIEKQVRYLKVSIESKNPFIDEIEEKILPCLKNDIQRDSAIRVLCTLGIAEYALSDSSLEQLSLNLYVQNDLYTGAEVCRALERFEERLKPSHRLILKIQQDVLTLMNSEIEVDSKIVSMSRLIAFAQSKERMVASVFRPLNDIVRGSSYELIELTLEFCLVILQHGEAISPQLLHSITHLNKDELTQVQLIRQSLVLSHCLRQNSSVDPAAFLIVEAGFLYLSYRDTRLYLEALNIAVNRNHVIKNETVKALWRTLLYFDNESDQIISAEILFNSLISDHIEGGEEEYPIDDLLILIRKTSSQKLLIKLNALLARVNELKILNEDQFEMVCDEIQTAGSFEQQLAICEMFSSKDESPHLSPSLSEMIYFKKLEGSFLRKVRNLSPAQSLEKMMMKLSELSGRPQLLSQEFFIATAGLLDQFDKGEIGRRSDIELIIQFLEVIGNKQRLPDLIFDRLLHLANCFLCNPFNLLVNHIRKSEPLGELIVLDLTLIMLEHPDEVFRFNALEILRRVASYQELSDGLTTLVALEWGQDSEKSVERIHQHVQQGGRLSVGNGELLLGKLKNGENRQTILLIFDKVKSELPRVLHQKIFEYYRESFFLYPENQPDFTSFCLDALKNGRLEKSVETDFLEPFYRHFQDIYRLTTSEFHLLYFLIRSAGKQMNEPIFVNVIQFFLTTDETMLREQCLFLIFGYFSRLPDWSNNLLNRLMGLIAKVRFSCSEEAAKIDSNGISSLMGFFGLFFHPNARNPVFLNLHETEMFLNFLAYVVEDERSAEYFNPFEVQRKLLPLIPDEELFYSLVKWQPTSQRSDESKKEFQALKLRLYEISCRRQLARLLLFRQREDQLNLHQLNEFTALILHLGADPHILLHEDINEIRRRFVEKLLCKFDFFEYLLQEPKKKLFSVCQELDWDPDSFQRLISQLPRNTRTSELLQLLSLMNDYSVSPDEVETILESSIEECPISILISEVMAIQLVGVLQPFFSSHATSEGSERRWIEWTISSALSLCKQGWNLDALIDWLERTGGAIEGRSDRPFGIKDIAGVLSFAADFYAEIEESCFYQIVEEQNSLEEGKILEHLHAYLVEHHLSSFNEEKNLETLLDEIADPANNPKGFKFTHELNFTEIKECLKRAKDLYEKGQRDLLQKGTISRPIKEWSKKEIKSWANQIKRIRNAPPLSSSSSGNVDVALCLALFKRASVLLYKYEPRLTQLISTLILTEKTHPILSQISTGEGKSFIVAMIASIKALQGTPVDVLTSSPVLAKRDAELYKSFYKLFALEVSNNEDVRYESGLKACYAPHVDIVYGDPSNFQFDLLQDEYSGLGTRGTRSLKTSAVIIDEADNVLVEGNDTTAMLASPMPGMQELTPLLICIWLKIVSLDPLRDYRLADDESGFMAIDDSELESVRESTESQLLRDIEGITEGEEKAIKIPKHLEAFVRREAKYWVHSAWLAFYVYKPKHHYEIKLNQEGVQCVAPIDFANTGVIQLGTTWGEGLHQFIQIKHNLPVEALTLVTNYSSIHSYIKGYSDQVGMTGTLGSTAVKKLLNRMYGFHSIEIPTFLSRKQLKLPPRILSNRESWMESIAFGSIREAQLGRVVLIICETIDSCNEISEFISHHTYQTRLHNYSDDKSESNYFLDKVHDGNTIIVATNLAGRGTDIKISEEVRNKGGVHVCVTFLPVNSRVQQQAFGRASRRGEPGTVQLVLNHETLRSLLSSASDDILKILDLDPKLVETFRDGEERLHLKRLKAERLPDIELQDGLFLKYLTLLKKIRKSDEKAKKERGVRQLADSFSADSIYREEEIKIKREALQEKWGHWLRELSSQRAEFEKFDDFKQVALDKFMAFQSDVMKAYKSSTVIDNPIYYIRLGNELLNRSNALRHFLSKSPLCEHAIQAYNRAIEMDSIFSYNALYHKAYALVQLAKEGHKAEAKEVLNTMRQTLLDGPIQQLNAVALLMEKCEKEDDALGFSQLKKDLDQERQVYELLMQSSEQAIKQIEEAQKLIEINMSPIPCFSQVSRPKWTKEEAFVALQNELTPDQVGLTFNHLKAHRDLTIHSQLENTFKTLSPEIQTITLSFRSEELYSDRGKKYSLRALLPKNRHRMLKEEIKRSSESEKPTNPRITEGSGSSSSSSSSSSQPTVEKAISIGEHWERGGQALREAGTSFGNAVSRIAKPMTNPIKSFVIKKKDQLKDLYLRCKDTENIPVTLTIRNLKSSEILRKLRVFKFAETQMFGIGPIELTPNLCNGLKEHVPSELSVSIWFPPKYVEENREWEHYRPRMVKVSDLPLDVEGGEISILECSCLILEKLLQLTHSEESTLTWVLHALNQPLANGCIKETSHPMTLNFVGLNVENALKIAALTEHEHNQATLTIEGISPAIAQEIIVKADRTEQKMLIKHRKIQTEFSRINEKPSFIQAHRLNGYYYLYDMNEQLPLPWKSLVLLTTLSMAQIAGGVALTTLTAGFGASVGQGFIAEGAVDALRAFKTMYHREFDLANYAVQKAVSLSLILISGGFSNICKARTAGEVANDAMKVKSVLLKTASTYGDASYQSVKSTALISRKLITSIQQVSLEFGENVSKEIVKTSLNASTRVVLKRVEPALKKNIRCVIQDMFKKEYWDGALHKMFAVDAFLGNEDQFKILEVKVRSLIVNAEFKGQRLTVFDREVLARFERELDQCLNDTSQKLKDNKKIFQDKFITMGSDFDKIWNLLIDGEIISPSGMINVLKKDAYARIQSLGPLSAPSQPGKLDLSETRTKLILDSLSLFRRYLRDDYFIQKRKLINLIHELFYEQFEHSLKTVAQTANFVVASAATAAVGVGFSQASRAIETASQEGGNDVGDLDDLQETSSSTTTDAETQVNISTKHQHTKISQKPRIRKGDTSKPSSQMNKRSERRLLVSSKRANQTNVKGAHRLKLHRHPQHKLIHLSTSHRALIPTNPSMNAVSKLSMSHFTIKAIFCGVAAGSLQALHAACWSEYQYSLKRIEEQTHCLLSLTAISEAEKIVAISRDLRKEQISSIRKLIGQWLIQDEMKEQKVLDERKVEALDAVIDEILDKCREDQEVGRSPICWESQRIGVSEEKSSTHPYLKELLKGWNHYKKLEEMEREALTNFLGSIDDHLFIDKGVTLAKQQQYSELGVLMQMRNGSTGAYVGGIIIQHLGDVAKTFVEGKKLSIQLHARLQCMSMALMEQTLAQESIIQKEILLQVEQRDAIVEKIISHRTEIAKIVHDNYGKFLEELYKVVLIENREDRLREVERVKQEYFSSKQEIDETVLLQVTLVKVNSSAPDFLTQCVKRAAEIIPRVMDVVKEISGKDGIQVRDFSQQIERAMRGLYSEGASSSSSSSMVTSTI